MNDIDLIRSKDKLENVLLEYKKDLFETFSNEFKSMMINLAACEDKTKYTLKDVIQLIDDAKDNIFALDFRKE